MNAVHKAANRISPAEYLAGELRSEIRHEYFAGEVFAMAGSSLPHNRIAGDIHTELNLHLRGKRCEAFINDMKAHVSRNKDELFYYPDVFVNCDPSGQHQYYCDTPSVIFEVLSPSTESIDRREKRLAYQSIPSLHTYVLVAQERREVTVYRRTTEGWMRQQFPDDGASVEIPELEFTLTLDAIYRRTEL